jgi:rare lipoprotein A
MRAGRTHVLFGCGVSLLLVGACFSPAPALARSRHRPREVGVASFYGREWSGHRTASGERFDPGALTAAHRTLPFGTRVKVTNLENGRQIVVRINDRGPFVRGRVLDLSRAAAKKLDFLATGTATVRIDVLKSPALAANER